MTKIADVIVPELFTPYVINASIEGSALFQSGVVVPEDRISIGARSGGETVNMPFWNDLGEDEEELSDSKALTPGKITSGQDVAVLQAVGKAWTANDLAGTLSGDDPMKAIGDLVGEFWARVYQGRLISMMNGAFAAANMDTNVFDISGETGAAAIIDKLNMVDARQKMGDQSGLLTGVMTHSDVAAKLEKDDLIDTEKGSDGKDIEFYQGRRLIRQDAGMEPTDGVYTTYLFGAGAFGYAEGDPEVPVETDRDSLGGNNYLINRRHLVVHPRGVKWIGSATVSTGDAVGGHPTRAELATGTNWTRVYDPKKIRMVQFKHRIAAAA